MRASSAHSRSRFSSYPPTSITASPATASTNCQIAGALTYLDFVLLALKTCAFGFIIAIVTCYHGLAQPLQLNEISRATVRAVAQSIIACVLIDALFIIIYLTI